MACSSIRLAFTAALAAMVLIPAAAQAQSSPSAYTSGTRYDAMGRVTGMIAPDPDGGGSLKYAATRNTYDVRGNLIKVETGELSSWKAETVAPSAWGTAFTVQTIFETTYDAIGRKTKEVASGKSGSTITPVSVTQYSYDPLGRLECTAVRMNPAVYGSLPASACNLGTEGTDGPDRITKNLYDAASQLRQIRTAVGTTSLESAEVTYRYTGNGKIWDVVDANGNRARLTYDGHDRQESWIFPSITPPAAFDDSSWTSALATAGSFNQADYEQYGYDASGNRTSLRKRDGSTIAYEYDALNRMTKKTVPDRADLDSIHERNVYYAYDLRGLMTEARFGSLTGPGITTTYDGFGRKTAELQDTDGNARTISSSYDRDGNRTGIVHPDASSFGYTYDGLDRLLGIKQGGTELGSVGYNVRGLVEKLSWHYGAANWNETTRGFDTAGRLNALALNVNGTSYDVAWSYTRNPASQILSEARDNDVYAWNGHENLTRNYTTNGLNQYTAAGPASFCYDANGNLTADGTSVYLYDVENRLVEKRVQTNGNCSSLSYAGTWEASLRYDPMGRLYQLDGPAPGLFRFVYDGDALALEYNGSGAILRRYVHGADAGADDPLVWYEGSAVNASTRRYMHTDPRGSIVLVTDYLGTQVVHNTYDEYGIPGSTNDGRFQYTGQAWLPELGMYYYKARIYSPTLGRFLQTDPIGYSGGGNLYAYVGNDPINYVDPTGLYTCSAEPEDKEKCDAVKRWREELVRVRKESKSGRERRAAARAIRALGRPGKENGVEVNFDNSLDSPGQTEGGSITFNMNLIERNAESNGVSTQTYGMVVLGHEAIHAMQRNYGNSKYQREITAYTHDYWIGRSQGWDQRAALGDRSFRQYLKLRAFESCRMILGKDTCWRQEDAWENGLPR